MVKEEILSYDGVITELLPNATFRVKLENGNYITETLVTHKNSTISVVKKEIPLLD